MTRTAQRNLDVLAGELLRGAIDMHVHANPHVASHHHMGDAVEIAQAARNMGMKGMVLKDTSFPTTATAYFANKCVPGFHTFGSIVLNLVCGGINPRAVAVAVEHGAGAKLVYFPTGDSLHHALAREKIQYTGINLPVAREQAITILRDGQLTPETLEVIRVIADANVCLVTGHLSARETVRLVPEALTRGVKKIIVLHTMWQMIGFTADDLKKLSTYPVYFEFEFGISLPLMQFIHCETPVNPRRMLEVMREIGVHKCIMTTDSGQAYAPSPPAAMKYFIAVMLRCGATEDEVRQMVAVNPAKLLDL